MPSCLDVRRSSPSRVWLICESVAYGPPLVVVVHQYRICQAVFLTPVQHICREWEQLAEFTASPPTVLPDSFALHPAVVLAIAYDVDLLDVIHTDVGSKHGPICIPREPVSVAEAVGVDFAERFRIAV